MPNKFFTGYRTLSKLYLHFFHRKRYWISLEKKEAKVSFSNFALEQLCRWCQMYRWCHYDFVDFTEFSCISTVLEQEKAPQSFHVKTSLLWTKYNAILLCWGALKKLYTMYNLTNCSTGSWLHNIEVVVPPVFSASFLITKPVFILRLSYLIFWNYNRSVMITSCFLVLHQAKFGQSHLQNC